jgi:hypothetical protein
MTMNNATATIAANAICTALGVTDPAAIAVWVKIMQQLYASLKTDAVVAVASVSGVTTGPSASGPGTGHLT